MASIIPGYNYDIFISYRQKDNKGDRWVSEFVDALKDELESTFKEEISVYFDINPHDGLLETHDVDESLKEKLKCLVFIPIISRTYCDPKSFAWEHEFKTFIKQASKDQFGLKVKLPGGNVASRVLPIQIHDLDKGDIKLCESVIGGVLRGIEFIYKSPGINRPLLQKEESPQDNLSHTNYRDQVNKVANAIKDVLNSLTTKELPGDEAIKEATEGVVDQPISIKRPSRKKAREIPTVSLLYKLKNLVALSRKTLRIAALVLFCILLSFGAYWLGLRNAATPPDRAVFMSDIPLEGGLSYAGRKSIAISRNGEFLVYAMNNELNLKLLSSDAPSNPIPGTTNCRQPFFSPDGKWIGFENREDLKIMKVPLTGGNPITICDLWDGRGINWQRNEIIFAEARERAIYRVPDSGGSPELIYPLNKSENDPRIWNPQLNPDNLIDPRICNPQLLPDNKTLLFSQQQEDGSWDIMTWQLESKENPVVMVEKGRDGRYLNSGHIVYSMDHRLYIRKFDFKTNRFVSEPQIITTRPVYEITSIYVATTQFDFSDNGILVYYEEPNVDLSPRHLVWIEKSSGKVTPITRDTYTYLFPTISSDAQNIAVRVMPERGGNSQIYIVNTVLGTSSLFAKDAQSPVWSNDNSSLIYFTPDYQVIKKSLDNKLSDSLFKPDSTITNLRLVNLSSDGKYLYLFMSIPGRFDDIGYYDMSKDTVVMLDYINSERTDNDPAISPDGKWIAYKTTYGGHDEIKVAPFPGPGYGTKVSLDRESGFIWLPLWAPDMTALYYLTTLPDYELWEVKVKNLEESLYDEPQSIFNGGNYFSTNGLAIHPDGDRFLAIQYAGDGTQDVNQELVLKVIVNWEQEFIDK